MKINALVHKEIFYVKGRDDNKVFHKDNYGKILESLVQLEFEYGSQEANDIHVNIICPYNIICDDPIFVIPSLGSNSKPANKASNESSVLLSDDEVFLRLIFRDFSDIFFLINSFNTFSEYE